MMTNPPMWFDLLNRNITQIQHQKCRESLHISSGLAMTAEMSNLKVYCISYIEKEFSKITNTSKEK